VASGLFHYSVVGSHLRCAVGVRGRLHHLRGGLDQTGEYDDSSDQDVGCEVGVFVETLLELLHDGSPFKRLGFIIGLVFPARLPVAHLSNEDEDEPQPRRDEEHKKVPDELEESVSRGLTVSHDKILS
jgi:hypothetical protein